MPTSGPPELTDLVLTTDGLSYIRVGRPIPTTSKSQGIVTWNTNICGPIEAGISGWETLFPAVPAPTDDHRLDAFDVFPRFGSARSDATSPIGLIAVYSPAIRTPHGLGVGSTVVDLKKLGAQRHTGDRFADESGYIFDPWVISGAGGELVFWVWQGTDTKAGYQLGKVSFELVQEKDTKPYFPYELDHCS